jgi:putative phage-type endonuclease
MKLVTAEQRSPDWFAARLGKATASNFANVLAAKSTAAYRNYRVKLALERMTGKQEDSFQSDAMRQGTEREPLARIAYEAHTGHLVEEVGFCLHDVLECGASPDGLVNADGGLEIKCPTPGKHFEYLRQKGEPAEYTAQIQGCMWITGRTWWDFVSFCPEFPENAQLIVRTIARDGDYIDRLAAAVDAFMAEVRADVEAISNFKVAA